MSKPEKADPGISGERDGSAPDERAHQRYSQLLLRSIADPSFRVSIADLTTDLRNVWLKLEEFKLLPRPDSPVVDFRVCDLFSAAIDYRQAKYAQEVMAWTRKGGTLPGHQSLKDEIAALLLSHDSDQVEAAKKLVAEISGGEFWTERRCVQRLRQIENHALKLKEEIIEALRLPALLAALGPASRDHRFLGMTQSIDQFLECFGEFRNLPSQSGSWLEERKNALCRLVNVMKDVTGSPQWQFQADLVSIESDTPIDPATLRTEHSDYVRKNS